MSSLALHAAALLVACGGQLGAVGSSWPSCEVVRGALAGGFAVVIETAAWKVGTVKSEHGSDPEGFYKPR